MLRRLKTTWAGGGEGKKDSELFLYEARAFLYDFLVNSLLRDEQDTKMSLGLHFKTSHCARLLSFASSLSFIVIYIDKLKLELQYSYCCSLIYTRQTLSNISLVKCTLLSQNLIKSLFNLHHYVIVLLSLHSTFPLVFKSLQRARLGQEQSSWSTWFNGVTVTRPITWHRSYVSSLPKVNIFAVCIINRAALSAYVKPR